MKIYGLYSDKQDCLMSISFSDNGDADFCNDISASLSKFFKGDMLWITLEKEVANKIIENGSTKWYNTDRNNPEWDVRYYGKLKVVLLNDL